MCFNYLISSIFEVCTIIDYAYIMYIIMVIAIAIVKIICTYIYVYIYLYISHTICHISDISIA